MRLLLWLQLLFTVTAVHRPLKDYGAIPACSTVACAKRNGEAFVRAARSAEPGDTVEVEGNRTYHFMPTVDSVVTNLVDVTFRLKGTLVLHDDYESWPRSEEDTFVHAVDIQSSQGVRFNGGGTVDGQGAAWWRAFTVGDIPRKRPTVLNFDTVTNLTVSDLILRNSPRFNIYAHNVTDASFGGNLTIWVDGMSRDQPFFPLNTDGVDVSGRRIRVHGVNISNFDDAVAVKPLRDGDCTEYVVVEDVTVYRGVGLSVGAVVPEPGGACVQHVLFQNILATDPLKFIYIKTGTYHGSDDNPTGSVRNITYADMSATGSVLWPIYIGPQQQEEPDGSGDGLWPTVDPRVAVHDVTLRNITVTDSTLRHAGVLRCNHSAPCGPIRFDRVSVSRSRSGYVCSAVIGTYDTRTAPVPCVELRS